MAELCLRLGLCRVISSLIPIHHTPRLTAIRPNPLKVAIFLEELAIAYEEKYIGFTQLKQESFESLNPNGRLPAIEDPNTAVTLFEVRPSPLL